MQDCPAETPEPPQEAFCDALRLWLTPGVGGRMYKVLVEHFGSPAAVLAASESSLREVPGVGPKLARAIVGGEGRPEITAELELCRRHGIRLLTSDQPAYPHALKEIHDPPGVLFLRGTLLPGDALAIAIVGTRHATHYGLRQAERLAGSLARAGLTIVSGLARGIDAAAHRAALAAGGRTIAVLAAGVLNIYPPEHQTLAEEIAAQGALLSESPPDGQMLAGMFPQRNRLISGLSLGVIVVEAGDRSGALITARHALEQGREVFAVPGSVENRNSRGCHRLIRDGAKLVESPDDVLEELGHLVQAAVRPNGQEIHHPAELLLNEIEQQVLGAIRCEATAIDEIVSATGLGVPQVLSTLSVLEMRRLVRRLSGTTVLRL